MAAKCFIFILWSKLFIGFVLWNFVKCEMECEDPPSISHGFYVVNVNDKIEIMSGTQANYSCKPGYKLRDPSVSRLTCILNEDGDDTLWVGDIPTCQALEHYCELPPEIPNGVVISKSVYYVLPDERVEILCNIGFKFNGHNRYPYCNKSALWEDKFGECKEITCDRPEPLANGDIPELEKSDFNDVFPYNFVLTYDCKEGYRLKGGEPWRLCRENGWSRTDPYCEEIFCPDPGVPQHGSRQGDSFKVGAKVRFECSPGYQLLGSIERYCSPNGKWTGKLARCNAQTNYCPNPGIPINGIRNGESYDEGDTIELLCRSGFIQVGSKERTCMSDRTWSGIETKCLGPHDFDSNVEIGRNLKQRLDEKFDEEIGECKLSAHDSTGVDQCSLESPSNGKLIMYFAFDVSERIQKINFKKGIEFAKGIVRKIGVSENGAHVGALVFSTYSDNKFLPKDFKNTQDVLDQLDAIEYTDRVTSADSVLQLITDNMRLQEHKFDTSYKKTVLFLITDGRANMGDRPEIAAEILKYKMNVDIFCIGITGDMRAEALYKIASTSKNGDEEQPNVFLFKNYEKLNRLVQDLNKRTLDYSQCGLGMESKLEGDEGRIIGGEKSLEHWPWMATLFFKDPKNKAAKPQLKCGGSIINELFILTAAQCLIERDKSRRFREISKDEIIVKLGLVNLKNYTEIVQEFAVETISVHGNYSPGNTYDNDIALLKLNRPITYTAFVRPVCLPPAVLPEDKNSPLYKDDEYGWVTGFGHEKIVRPGAINTHYRLSNQLKELRLPIQKNETCSSSLPRWLKTKGSFTERMFCAGDGLSGNDTCQGDSGGPFMQPQMNSQGEVYWTQVGIVSWGIGCGNIGQYGFYTNVQRFRDWIDMKTKEIVP